MQFIPLLLALGSHLTWGEQTVYPETLNVSSTGGEAKALSSWIGIYTQLPGISAEGRPVWQHESLPATYIFFSSNGFWRVGPDYNTASGWIWSKHAGLEDLPYSQWNYDTLRVGGLRRKAVASYDAKGMFNQINLEAGEQVEVLKQFGDKWTVVKNKDNKVGGVPTNHLVTLSIPSLWKATNAFNSRGVGGRIALRKEETVVEVSKAQNNRTKVKTMAGDVGDVPTSLLGSAKTWRAVNDYDPEGAPDHLKVQEGELLLERTPEEDGLTRVQNKQGEHGLVPSNTLEELDTTHVPVGATILGMDKKTVIIIGVPVTSIVIILIIIILLQCHLRLKKPAAVLTREPQEVWTIPPQLCPGCARELNTGRDSQAYDTMGVESVAPRPPQADEADYDDSIYIEDTEEDNVTNKASGPKKSVPKKDKIGDKKMAVNMAKNAYDNIDPKAAEHQESGI